MVQYPPRSHRSPLRRIAVLLLVALFALAFVTVLATTAAERNLDDPEFYKGVLDREDAYDRAYDDILFDGDLAETVEDLLGGVDIPEDEIQDLVEEIVPPGRLRSAVEDAVDRVVAHMARDEDLELFIEVTDFVEAIAQIVVDFTVELIVALPERASGSYEAFIQEFAATLETIDGGGIPDSIPAFLIPEEDAPVVAALILETGQIDPDSDLGAGVVQAIRDDNVAGALKLATGSILLGIVAQSIDELVARLDEGPRGELRLAAPGSLVERLEDRLALPRRVLDVASIARVVAAAIGLVALGAIVVLALPSWRSALRWAGIALAVAGALALASWAVARQMIVDRVGDVVVRKAPDFPSSFSTLVEDVLHSAVTELDPAFWLPAGVALVAGIVVTAAGFFFRESRPAA